jgi:hypothetical protein
MKCQRGFRLWFGASHFTEVYQAESGSGTPSALVRKGVRSRSSLMTSRCLICVIGLSEPARFSFGPNLMPSPKFPEDTVGPLMMPLRRAENSPVSSIIVLVVNLSDDLLKDVFQGHDPQQGLIRHIRLPGTCAVLAIGEVRLREAYRPDT